MAGPEGLIIAIDGVVGAGKSSTARQVAKQLGYRHIDTGAMYRAVTLAAVRRDIDAQEEEVLASLLQEIRIELEPQHQGGRVLLDDEDISSAIRRPEVTRRVGAYADLPLVRRALVAQQQAMGIRGGVVAEGRDAGSVVFPGADLKVLMVASLEERASRRQRELTEKGVSISLEQVTVDIESRDRADAERDYGAESDPGEIVTLDTTDLTFDAQVERIVAWARQRDVG
jgi:cytidylate kinase